MADVLVVWFCGACRKPVHFTATADKRQAGWHVHSDEPIAIHLKQHEGA